MKSSKTLSFLIAPLLFLSCEKGELQADKADEFASATDRNIIVGEKLDSPFTLKNMQRAMDSLCAKAGLRSSLKLDATHFYVRFLPKDTLEYDRLKSDTTLDIFSYPLDREISEGDYYHDPSLPEGQITWQYTKVPADYPLLETGLRFEILDSLYIENEDIDNFTDDLTDSELRSSISDKDKRWTALAQEAIRQAGNDEDDGLRSRWNPSATIMAYDDIVGGYIPLEGVKVKARHFLFLVHARITDKDGKASFNRMNCKANYSIEWERSFWEIKDGGAQAYYNGPKKRGEWILKIGEGTIKNLHYSAIHRALYRYYYGSDSDRCGLKKLSTFLKIRYCDEKDDNGALGSTYGYFVEHFNHTIPSIRIYKKTSRGNRPASGVLSTTLHELAHASHCKNVGYDHFKNTTKTIKESYAIAIQAKLTEKEYQSLNINTKTNKKLSILMDGICAQQWPFHGRSKIYSPLIIDMEDSYNQNTAYLKDNVDGFNLVQIERALYSIQNVKDFKEYILRQCWNKMQKVKGIELYFQHYEKYMSNE